jgi:hypothetical protein
MKGIGYPFQPRKDPGFFSKADKEYYYEIFWGVV